MSRSLLGCAIGLVLMAQAAFADNNTLTLHHVHKLTRQNALRVLASHTAVREAVGARAGATPLLTQNPSISGGAGLTAQPSGSAPRDWGAGGAAQLEVQVPIDIAGQRWQRLATADARIRSAGAHARSVLLAALREASEAFYRALHAQGVAELEASLHASAVELQAAARAKQQSGLGSPLETELAALEEHEARQVSQVAALTAERLRSELEVMVGLPPDAFSRLEGTLASTAPIPDLGELLAQLPERPDLVGLEADRRVAVQEADLARLEGFPTPTVGAAYQFQHQSPAAQHVLLGVVSFPLPVFVRGQGEENRARSRALGLADEHHQALLVARAELRAAHALLHNIRAARTPAQPGPEGPGAVEEHLLRAYRQRSVDLATVLNMRRRVVAVHRSQLDLDLQDALARVWLDSAVGRLQ